MNQQVFERDATVVLGVLSKAKRELYLKQILFDIALDASHARRVLAEMEVRGMVVSRTEGSGPKRRKWYRVTS